MQKLLMTLSLIMATQYTVAADHGTIRLDAPNAMQSLARSNPDHHQRASKLLLAAATQPC